MRTHETRRLVACAFSAFVLLLAGCTNRADSSSTKPVASSSTKQDPTPVIETIPEVPAAPVTPRFVSTIAPIGSATIAKMGTSWRPGCPVPLEDLRVISMTYWGFDRLAHTGELMVHERYAKQIAGIFKSMFEDHFPIERMELANGYMGNDPPLAQPNNTVGFHCRAPVGGGRRWSEHSYGRAVDINPLQNPYISRSGHIEPLFAERYLDRSLKEPGMIRAGDRIVQAFRAMGWKWGGYWSGTKDYMHFSATGR